jgi:hypothetical protein
MEGGECARLLSIDERASAANGQATLVNGRGTLVNVGVGEDF